MSWLLRSEKLCKKQVFIAFSIEKVISSESGEKHAQIRHCLQAKTAEYFFTGVMKCNGVKLKWWICFLQTCSFSLHNTLIDGWSCVDILVDYCDFIVIIVTLILTAPIHCMWSIGEQMI